MMQDLARPKKHALKQECFEADIAMAALEVPLVS